MTTVQFPAPPPASVLSTPLPGPPVTAPPVAAPARRAVRGLLWAGLVTAFVVVCAVRGLPTDRVVLLGWVLAGLAVHAATDGWRRVVRLVADWLPLVALLLAYDATRGVADRVGMPVHVAELIAVDRALGLGELPTVWLQAYVDSRAWEGLAALVYGSHFVVTPVVLAVLWLRDRQRWRRFASLVIALSAAGLVTYVLYPAAPPWWAAREGLVEPVERLSGAGWAVLGLPRAGALLADSQAQVNPVAAVPSLHTAFAVLVCLVLLPEARRAWQRAGLLAYAVAMPVVLVWSGEHWVVDTVLGALYAAAVVLLVPRIGPAVDAVRGRAAAPGAAGLPSGT